MNSSVAKCRLMIKYHADPATLSLKVTNDSEVSQW